MPVITSQKTVYEIQIPTSEIFDLIRAETLKDPDGEEMITLDRCEWRLRDDTAGRADVSETERLMGDLYIHVTVTP